MKIFIQLSENVRGEKDELTTSNTDLSQFVSKHYFSKILLKFVKIYFQSSMFGKPVYTIGSLWKSNP